MNHQIHPKYISILTFHKDPLLQILPTMFTSSIVYFKSWQSQFYGLSLGFKVDWGFLEELGPISKGLLSPNPTSNPLINFKPR